MPWELVPESAGTDDDLLAGLEPASASLRPTARSPGTALAVEAAGDAVAALLGGDQSDAAVGSAGASSRPTAAASFSSTATAGVDRDAARGTAAEGTAEAPSPWEDFELDVEDVYILVAVEFDRGALRADFIVRDQILPAYFPLNTLMDWVVGAWVGPTGTTRVCLYLRLTNGRCFRITAIAPGDNQLPVLQMSTVETFGSFLQY